MAFSSSQYFDDSDGSSSVLRFSSVVDCLALLGLQLCLNILEITVQTAVHSIHTDLYPFSPSFLSNVFPGLALWAAALEGGSVSREPNTLGEPVHDPTLPEPLSGRTWRHLRAGEQRRPAAPQRAAVALDAHFQWPATGERDIYHKIMTCASGQGTELKLQQMCSRTWILNHSKMFLGLNPLVGCGWSHVGLTAYSKLPLGVDVKVK